jgi:uncharacterized membrane protein
MDTNTLTSYSEGTGLPFSLSTATLIASLFWGTIGVGLSIYGKKQRSAPPWFGGLTMIAISYFISSAIWMSVAAVGIIAGIWLWSKYGSFD